MAFSLGSGLKGLPTDYASRRSGTYRSFATQADSFPCPYVSPQLRKYCALRLAQAPLQHPWVQKWRNNVEGSGFKVKLVDPASYTLLKFSQMISHC
jgi:hypothetical protein